MNNIFAVLYLQWIADDYIYELVRNVRLCQFSWFFGFIALLQEWSRGHVAAVRLELGKGQASSSSQPARLFWDLPQNVAAKQVGASWGSSERCTCAPRCCGEAVEGRGETPFQDWGKQAVWRQPVYILLLPLARHLQPWWFVLPQANSLLVLHYRNMVSLYHYRYMVLTYCLRVSPPCQWPRGPGSPFYDHWYSSSSIYEVDDRKPQRVAYCGVAA